MQKLSKTSDVLITILTSEETFTIINSIGNVVTAISALVTKIKGGNNNGNPKF